MLKFIANREIVINRDNIMPSRHKRVDIRWCRNISAPSRHREKAKSKLMNVGVILVIVSKHILMSRNH